MADVKTEKKFASLETAKKINDDVASLKEDLSKYAKSMGVNIARTDNLISSNKMGANIVTNDDGSIEVTPTVSYGRYDFSYNVDDDNEQKVFYIAIKIKGNNDIPVKSALSLYLYDSAGTNLSTTYIIHASSTTQGDYIVLTYLVRYLDEQINAVRMVIGVISGLYATYTITDKSMLIIDVTGVYSDDITLSDFVSFYGVDYFEKPIAQTAQTAQIAQTAQTAQTAQIAQTAQTAQKITQPLPVLTDGVEITHNNNSWYSDILFSKPTSGKSYLCFVKLYEDNLINGIGITSTISGYETLIGVNNKITIDDETYAWGVLKAGDNAKTLVITFSASTGEDKTKVYVFDSTENSRDLTKDYLVSILKTHINGGVGFLDLALKSEIPDVPTNNWKGKNALVIGDSITAANKWQNQLNTILGMNVSTHAKGGVGMIAMVDGDKGLGGDYDNTTSASGTLYPLSVDDVKDMDLIVFLGGYNNRGTADGELGDCYNTDGSGQSTIAGYTQYCINRIYEVLTEANNLTCKVLLATPHCAGKYSYINADGYEDWGATGRTMETLSNIQKKVANYNNIPVCDLWHESGINRFTWDVLGATDHAVNDKYVKYEINAEGNVIGSKPLTYVVGNSYYQWRDGAVVLEKYTSGGRYPYNTDQLHCSAKGYERIGGCICGAVIRAFGN
jgi:hypothetical protein